MDERNIPDTKPGMWKKREPGSYCTLNVLEAEHPPQP